MKKTKKDFVLGTVLLVVLHTLSTWLAIHAFNWSFCLKFALCLFVEHLIMTHSYICFLIRCNNDDKK